MLRLRLDEQPAPSGKDADMLIAWLLDTLGLVRRRNDADSSDATQRPLLRLMRDQLLKEPMKGRDAKSLAKNLDISMTALHHHLKGLQSARLVTSQNGPNGWQMHHLRCGSLSAAIDLLHREVKGILTLRLEPLQSWQTGSPDHTGEDGIESLSLKLTICEPRPLLGDEDDIDAFLNDFGLRGERPKQSSGDDLTRLVFEKLLSANHPISLDEAVAEWGATRPRLARTFDRLRAAGLSQRVLRHDRMSVILWDAISSQYKRRGKEWLLSKGGLGRIDEKISKRAIKALENDKFDTTFCAELFSKVSAEEQRLAINLLGGRLPYGYRLSGNSGEDVGRHISQLVDSLFTRLKRVAATIDDLN
ncbi:MAG: helix-turn-helix transcriptional regulator [Euryarchaeota archaeon]|jgi:DNA-binding MarR family transcriptional regulator|nr:helix-turn-helix transcriptional regulator [Euryarchaeota archaeon]